MRNAVGREIPDEILRATRAIIIKMACLSEDRLPLSVL